MELTFHHTYEARRRALGIGKEISSRVCNLRRVGGRDGDSERGIRGRLYKHGPAANTSRAWWEDKKTKNEKKMEGEQVAEERVPIGGGRGGAVRRPS